MPKTRYPIPFIVNSEAIVAILLIVGILVCSVFGQVDTVSDSISAVPEWGDVEISGELSTDSLPQNDTLEYTVQLRIIGNPDDYAIADPGNPPVANLKLIGTSQSNRTEGSAENVVLIKEYRYKYVPVTIGMAYVNPHRVQYIYTPNGKSRTLSTTRLEVEVTEAVLPKEKMGLTPIIVIVAVVLLVAAAIIVFIMHSRKQAEPEEAVEVPPEEKARQALKELNKTASDDPEKLINGLAKLMSEYILERYGITLKAQSEDELISALEGKGLAGATLNNLRNALKVCNQVRFAAHSASRADVETVELGFESLLNYGKKENTEDKYERGNPKT